MSSGTIEWFARDPQLHRSAYTTWHNAPVRTAQEAKIPTLYHYECFNPEYFEDILVNNRIHVSNIGNVNDPWDCRPWFDVNVSDVSRRREWAERLRPLVESSEQLTKNVTLLDEPWETHERFLSESIKGISTHTHALNVQRWRMYCLTPHSDSILMWSHYSGKHTGICLGFDTAGNYFGRAQEVNYSDHFPAITPEMFAGDRKPLTDAILLTKAKSWDYETEYRLLPRDEKIDPDFSLTCKDEYLSLPEGALTTVITGEKISKMNIEAVRSLLRAHASHVQLKQAVCVPHKYEIAIIT